MQASTSIPPDLEPALLRKAGEGLTTRQLSAWLLEAHGVSSSHAAVARLLARHRAERADVAKGIVRETLARTLTSDLDILAKHVARLDRMTDEAESAGDPDLYFRAVEQMRKLIDTRLHYSGADQPDAPADELAALGERVAGRLLSALAGSDASRALGEPEPEGEGGA